MVKMLWKFIFGNSINQNENIVTLLFVFYTCFGFSQDKELYRMAFADKNNFNYLNFYVEDNIKNLKQFLVYDKTHFWNTNYFKIRNINIKDRKIIDSLNILEHHPYNHTYLFKNQKLAEIFNEEEQEYLFDKAINNGNRYYGNFDNAINFIRTFPEKGIYFTVSSIIYSRDHQYAFLEVKIYQNLDYFGNCFFIFRKSENGKWEQYSIQKDVIQ